MPTITSSPSRFTINSNGSATVTFAIPAGSYTSATWNRQVFYGAGNSDADIITTVASSSQVSIGNGANSVSATGNQLSDINGAAGGTLTVSVTHLPSGNETYTSFTLTITAGSGTTYTDSPGVKVGVLPQLALQVLAGVKVATADLQTVADTNGTRAAVKAGTTDAAVLTETAGTRAGVRVSVGSVYTETTDTNAGVKVATTDAILGLDLPAVKAAVKLADTDAGVFTDHTGTRAAVKVATADEKDLAGGGIEYVETTGAKAAGAAAVADVGAFVEADTTKAGVHVATTDAFVPQGVQNIFEANGVRAGGKAGILSDLLVAASSSGTRAAAKLTTVDALVSNDMPMVKAAVRVGTKDSWVITETDGVKVGVKLVSRELLSMVQNTGVKAGVKLSLADVYGVNEHIRTKAAVKVATADTAVYTLSNGTHAGVKVASLVGAGNGGTFLEANGARAGVKVAIAARKDILFGKDTVGTHAGVKLGISEIRAIVEKGGTRAGVRVRTTDAAVLNDNPGTMGGGSAFVCDSSNYPFDDLITRLRYNVMTALPELVSVQEALEDAPVNLASMPYVIIVAQEPRNDTSWAVNDQASWIPVDFVYVTKQVRDGSTDTPQNLRIRMEFLAAQLLNDYHELGPYTSGIVTMTEMVATPFDRMSAYQEFFAGTAQPVTVMVLTFEFLIISSLVCR